MIIFDKCPEAEEFLENSKNLKRNYNWLQFINRREVQDEAVEVSGVRSLGSLISNKNT